MVTTGILLRVGLFVPLRMPDDQLRIGDDAVHGESSTTRMADDQLRIGDDAAHGEEPYVLWPLGRWPEFRRDTQ